MLHILSLEMTSIFFKRQSTINLPVFLNKWLCKCACPKLSDKIDCCPSKHWIGIRTTSEFRNLGFRLTPLYTKWMRSHADRIMSAFRSMVTRHAADDIFGCCSTLDVKVPWLDLTWLIFFKSGTNDALLAMQNFNAIRRKVRRPFQKEVHGGHQSLCAGED